LPGVEITEEMKKKKTSSLMLITAPTYNKNVDSPPKLYGNFLFAKSFYIQLLHAIDPKKIYNGSVRRIKYTKKIYSEQKEK
jgi:hypothetical protein